MSYPITPVILDLNPAPETIYFADASPSDDSLSRSKADLQCAIAELKVKSPRITLEYDYHEGDHPQIWLTDKLRSMFKALADQMPENYCGVAIDAPLRRLAITGFTTLANPDQTEDTDPEDQVTQGLSADDLKVLAIWTKNRLKKRQKEVYRSAMAAGEGFVFVWDNGGGDYDISFNDARMVHWHCNGGEVHHVAKVWIDDEEGVWRATLLYETDQVRFVGPKPRTGDDRYTTPDASAFSIDTDDPGGVHGFDQVPVFRFAEQDKRISRLKSLIPIQDKINKLESNKMVAAEFGAFKQRAYLTTQALDKESIKQEPDHAIHLDPGGDAESGVAPTSIFEFSATDLANYDQAKQKEVDAFFTIANLPRHMMVNPGASASGAAITADEGPFTEMILDMHEWLGDTWQELFGMLGFNVEPVWKNPKTDDEAGTALVVKTHVEAGVPVEMAERIYAGWDGDELDELAAGVEKQKQAESDRQQAMVKALDQGAGMPTPAVPPAPAAPVPPVV